MLSKQLCIKVMNEALKTGADYAEIFEEDKFATSISATDGVVDKINSGFTYGIGIRLYQGLVSVYSSTNDNSEEGLIKTVQTLASNFKGAQTVFVKELNSDNYENINKIEKFPRDYSINYKKAIMKRASDAAFAYDKVISKTSVYYLDEDQKVLIANSKGQYNTDQRVRTRISISSIATDGDKMENGYQAPGASMGMEFYDQIKVEEIAQEASKIAKTMLYADECPSGTMDVVINNGFGGVIFHEACGHGLEATSVAKNQSVFANKLNQKIASDVVTAIDDGTIPNAWGSLNIDDEGHRTQKNVLIENGVLKGYMIDNFNARRMRMVSSGSGRRQSYHLEPTSRMTNTYIANGKSTFEEIIAATKFGLFAAKLGGGSVNPTTGEFNFAVIEGYMIRDGKIAEPVKGASLVGNGADTLMNIDMVGNNLLRSQGMCGSISGSIPVDVGQPTIRVKNMIVGGRGGNL